MLTLSIFRHAKAAAGDTATKDFDRPLAESGHAAAPLMGAYLANAGLKPDLVLSSPALRTRETCTAAFKALQPPPEIRFEQVLYLASPKTLIGRLRRTAPSIRHVMVVGHNPGLQALALDLIASAPPKMLADLGTKLPTAGLVVLRLDIAGWTEIGPATASLDRFVTPRMLAA